MALQTRACATLAICLALFGWPAVPCLAQPSIETDGATLRLVAGKGGDIDLGGLSVAEVKRRLAAFETMEQAIKDLTATVQGLQTKLGNLATDVDTKLDAKADDIAASIQSVYLAKADADATFATTDTTDKLSE